MPLPEGVLTVNLGIPIIVVVNKSDVLENSSDIKKRVLNEKQEYIQRHLRRQAIKYGGALIYTQAAVKALNLNVLY